MSGAPTMVDYANGVSYARQQIAKMKCLDPDGITTACGTRPGCIKWKPDKSAQTFPIPKNIYRKDCQSDGDCEMGFCDKTSGNCTCFPKDDKNPCKRGMDCIQDPGNLANLVCGYAPTVDTGHCVFADSDSCREQGALPYTCDDFGYCTNIPVEKQTKSYTEWRKPTSDPSTGTPDPGRCVLGNFLLKMWCENPGSRCLKDPDTGEYPSECTGGENTRGVTDVPPFYYDDTKGNCYMTHDYCDVFGMDYNKKSCQDDSTCDKGDVCYIPPGTTSGHCTGPGSDCTESSGQKAGEFFLGKTLFYLFSKKAKCETFIQDKGKSKVLQEAIKEKLGKVTDSISVLSDERKVKEKKVLFPNFAGEGINLYLLTWKNGKEETGFLAQEVDKKYPRIVEKRGDDLYISIGKKDITDKNLKRIFLTLQSKTWMLDNVRGMLTELLKPKIK